MQNAACGEDTPCLSCTMRVHITARREMMQTSWCIVWKPKTGMSQSPDTNPQTLQASCGKTSLMCVRSSEYEGRGQKLAYSQVATSKDSPRSCCHKLFSLYGTSVFTKVDLHPWHSHEHQTTSISRHSRCVPGADQAVAVPRPASMRIAWRWHSEYWRLHNWIDQYTQKCVYQQCNINKGMPWLLFSFGTSWRNRTQVLSSYSEYLKQMFWKWISVTDQ